MIRAAIFCFRDEYYLAQEEPDGKDIDKLAEWQVRMDRARNRLDLIIAKQRMGETGTAKVMFEAPTGMIWEADR